jgi:serine/threonine protein kinase/beta-lactam-binding protein with PASTA domain
MQQKVLNNRYELEQKIGEGGMARVYRARDLRLNRLVAVKVLHSHYASDPGFLQRFHHEAQAAANLRHPNIVDVYDVGQEGDVHYIVMEYVQGSDLKSLILRYAPLPIEQAVPIAEAVANGLDTAHRVGLVHRDIKPQNVIVGEHGQVKITDFGIAKSAMSTAMTETGVTFGTADYISPEQARGQPATPRSDIYALGVTLYEMLTGRLPFTGDSSIAVAMQHVTNEPPPPRMYNPRIPVQLEAIVLRALNKEPDARPPSARDFARMLATYRDMGDQVTVMRPVAPRPAGTSGGAAPQSSGSYGPPRSDSSAEYRRREPRGASGTSAPRQVLPPPRPAVVAQAPPEARGLGFGGFLLGLLLVAGVLGLVYAFAAGWFNELYSLAGGGAQPPPPTAAVEQPTSAATPLPEVQVPDLANLGAADAFALLQSARLTPRQDPGQFSVTVPPGQVVDQFPDAFSVVTETAVVTFAVSLGPDTAEIPNDIVGLREQVARGRLEAAGLVVQVQQVRCDDTTSAGFVSRVEPGPGTRPNKGETVTLYVSLGNNTVVPDIYLQSLDEATRLLRAAGLGDPYVDFQGRDKLGDQYDQVAPNTVVSFEPSAGTEVTCGSTVNLGVRAP